MIDILLALTAIVILIHSRWVFGRVLLLKERVAALEIMVDQLHCRNQIIEVYKNHPKEVK